MFTPERIKSFLQNGGIYMSNTDELFSISQAAHACGVSRSTLMRMEEKGLITPFYINPSSGRRYYDPYNISQVMQTKKLLEMGFSAEDIRTYYLGRGEAAHMLAIMQEKMRFLQQYLEEIEMRAHSGTNLSVNITTIPEVVCCVLKTTGLTPKEKEIETYNFYHQCVKEGCILTAEPLFIINERTDYLEGKITTEPYPYYACVPVDPKHAPQTAKRFPACKALTVSYYGDYSGISSAWLKLGEEVKKRQLTPADFPRAIAIVAPYTGREIDPHHYCGKIALPIRD